MSKVYSEDVNPNFPSAVWVRYSNSLFYEKGAGGVFRSGTCKSSKQPSYVPMPSIELMHEPRIHNPLAPA